MKTVSRVLVMVLIAASSGIVLGSCRSAVPGGPAYRQGNSDTRHEKMLKRQRQQRMHRYLR